MVSPPAAGEHPCDHHTHNVGPCDTPTTRRYLTGWRCPQHTPAALTGRPETVPDPTLTLDAIRGGTNLFNTAAPTAIDTRAIASGKRRSTPSDYRAAQQTTTPRNLSRSDSTPPLHQTPTTDSLTDSPLIPKTPSAHHDSSDSRPSLPLRGGNHSWESLTDSRH